MPRFYLHLWEATGPAHDENGLELSDLAAAHMAAIEGIRCIVAGQARSGVIDLNGYIAVTDETGQQLLVIHFPEAFDLQLRGAEVEHMAVRPLDPEP